MQSLFGVVDTFQYQYQLARSRVEGALAVMDNVQRAGDFHKIKPFCMMQVNKCMTIC